jgi:hypothetical protein
VTRFTSTRECPGLYTVGKPGADHMQTVEVVQFTRRHDGVDYDYWIAKARWSQSTYSDPCTTKREALGYAFEILEARYA